MRSLRACLSPGYCPHIQNSGTLTNLLNRSVIRRVPEVMNCLKRGKLEYHQRTFIVMTFELSTPVINSPGLVVDG